MGMNFFEHQDVARRKTRWMVLLFIPAVIGVVAVVDIVISLSYFLVHAYLQQLTGYGFPHFSLSHTPPWVLLAGAGIPLAAILWQTLGTMRDLRDGGSAVADAFGARWVDPATQDPNERQLINVVEEMAIASGIEVPPTYILENERGLNACAAGNSVSDAIVVVTRGLLDNLSRDELQGVIGHEFSHILNGDMALNMRMMGMLSGIGAFGSLGTFLLRNSIVDHRMDGAPGKDAFLPTLLGGLVMVTVGYPGLVFARLIKAFVSREREYLADASSVQFTRNPECIVGALEKMRTTPAGTLIMNRYAEDASHMFIGQSLRPWLFGLFATHPPLEQRITRIMPDFSPMLFHARKRIAARAAETKAQPASSAQAKAMPPPLEFPGAEPPLRD